MSVATRNASVAFDFLIGIGLTRWMEEPVADRLKPAATQTFVRLRGLLKIKDSLEPAEAGFECNSPRLPVCG
jgi:hypothetical protein